MRLNSHPSGRHFLQIPGPTNVPDRILRAMDHPTIDHQRKIGLVARHDHAHGLDLIDRGVGRIAPARGGVEQDVALDGTPQGLFQRSQSRFTPA